MSKGLGKLKIIRHIHDSECGKDETMDKDFDIIEKELKALEIITNNFGIMVYYSRHRETGYEMSMQDSDNHDLFTMITEEDYNLLKEILWN